MEVWEKLVRQHSQTCFQSGSADSGRHIVDVESGVCVQGVRVVHVCVFTQGMDANRHDLDAKRNLACFGLEQNNVLASRVLECANAENVPFWTVYCLQEVQLCVGCQP